MLWPTSTAPPRNSSSDGSTASMRGAGATSASVRPGEHRDLRRDRPARVDERLERAEALAAADLDRADLGDHVVVAVAAGGLEVEDAERDVGERRAEVVEAALHRAVPNLRRRHRSRMTPRTSVRVKNTVRSTQVFVRRD